MVYQCRLQLDMYSRENSNIREGQADSTPSVDKHHFTWTIKAFDVIVGLNRGPIHCTFPRSSDPFYAVTYYIKWITTSWTYCIWIYRAEVTTINVVWLTLSVIKIPTACTAFHWFTAVNYTGILCTQFNTKSKTCRAHRCFVFG